MPKKHQVININTIRHDVEVRMNELHPLVEEYNQLVTAEELLDQIVKNGTQSTEK
jgi:hypothetical protein